MGEIRLEKANSVAVITISAPEVRNGLTPAMGRELVSHCADINADSSIGAVVVQGDGGYFCSGADTRRWDPHADQAEDVYFRDSGAIYQAFRRVGALEVPVVAAVRGGAVGAGLNLMLAADLRVVSESARLKAGFMAIGIHPGGGYFTISNRLIGREATAAMGLFNEEVDGRRAVELGLAWEAVPDEMVEPRALDFAERAASDPALVRQALRSMREELSSPGLSWDAALEFERATQMWSLRRQGDKASG